MLQYLQLSPAKKRMKDALKLERYTQIKTKLYASLVVSARRYLFTLIIQDAV